MKTTASEVEGLLFHTVFTAAIFDIFRVGNLAMGSGGWLVWNLVAKQPLVGDHRRHQRCHLPPPSILTNSKFSGAPLLTKPVAVPGLELETYLPLQLVWEGLICPAWGWMSADVFIL